MSILIRGMKMPKDMAVAIVVEANGDVYIPNAYWDCELLKGAKAVELPDHGDLIDRNAMAEGLAHDVEMDEKALDDTDIVGIEREKLQFDKDCKQNCIYYLTEQEPVIPAERE